MAVPPGISIYSYEIQFAINHLAHALLTKLCLPALQKAANEKGDAITYLACISECPRNGIIFEDLKSSQENLGKLPAGSSQGLNNRGLHC